MKFEKVPLYELEKYFGEECMDIYKRLQLPRRGTPGSAGYDFYLPTNICLSGKGDVKYIPTGICADIDDGYFLMCVPRSGLGAKFGFKIRNTVAIIDSDFSHSKTHGHIVIAAESDLPVSLHAGDRFMQGIFVPYGIVENDNPLNSDREGGYGSTGGMGE